MNAGTTIGHYKIIRPLGKGGMGEVYLADDTKLKREVAIKVLPSAVHDDADRLKRFRREAEAAAKLNHPNIATIHSIEEAEGQTFIVMEYVDGKRPTIKSSQKSQARNISLKRVNSIMRHVGKTAWCIKAVRIIYSGHFQISNHETDHILHVFLNSNVGNDPCGIDGICRIQGSLRGGIA